MPSTLLTCTSSTRPVSPNAGDTLFETDTKKIITSDGTHWYLYEYDGTTGFSNTHSVTLDGTNQSVELGTSSSTLFNFGTNDFSLSIWYKPHAVGNYFNLWSGHTGGGWLMYVGSGGALGFYGDNYTALPSVGSATVNGWNHGAVVRTSTKVKIYLNGSKIVEDTIASTAVFNKASSNIVGMGATGSNTAYNGEVDEAALWNSALSDGGVSTGATAGGDIATIYNSGVPNDISAMTPIGWWRMGETDSGTGTVVTDIGAGVGGTKLNGALTNGASFVTDVPT